MKSNKKLMLFGGVLLGLLLLGIAVLLFVLLRPGNSGVGQQPFYNLAVTFGEDPARDKNFCWYTDTGMEQCAVQYLPYEEGKTPDFTKDAAVLTRGMSLALSCQVPEEQTGELVSVPAIRHRVYLTGLESGTKYWYRIGDPEQDVWSETYLFETDDGGTDFSFLYVTDSQGFSEADYAIWKKVLEQAAASHSADFLVHLGDFVEDRHNEFLWRCFFDLPREYLANLSIVPVSGNKDGKSMMDHFTLGSRSDASANGNGWYSFDYGGVHFTVLYTGDDSEDLSKTQVKWLKKDLEASRAAWKVVLLHKAPYSDRNHADDREIVALREQLLPIFDEYGVRVVLQGHDHYYFRSEPVRNFLPAPYELTEVMEGDVRIPVYRANEGTVYFINGSAGAKQHKKEFREMEDIFTKESILCEYPTYTYCQVTENRILFKTYQVNVTNGVSTLLDAWGMEQGW